MLVIGCGFTDKEKAVPPDGVTWDQGSRVDVTTPPADGPQDMGPSDTASEGGWVCDEVYYDDLFDECDCGCGIPDPDCGGSGCSEVGCCDTSTCASMGCSFCFEEECL